MSIKQLKDDLKNKTVDYADELRNQTGEEFRFDCYTGTKILNLFLSGDNVATRLDVEIEYIRGGWMMCNVSQFVHQSWYDGKKEDIHAPHLLQFVVDYLIGYAKIKKMNGFLISAKKLDSIYEECLVATLTKNGFLEQSKTKFLVTSLDYPFRCFSYVLNEREETLQKMELLENELDVLHEENPLFVVVDYITYSPVDSPFKINYRIYYYEGERFGITLMPNNQVKIEGDEIGDREYEVVKGVAKTILQDIEEQKRLYNLINVPCKFTSDVLRTMGVYKGNDKAEYIVTNSDGVVGIGKTENDMKIINEVLTDISENPYYSNLRRAEENFLYKEYKNADYIIHRLKAENAIWFLATYKYGEAFIYPSDKEVIPKEVLRFISGNIEKDIVEKFQKI